MPIDVSYVDVEVEGAGIGVGVDVGVLVPPPPPADPFVFPRAFPASVEESVGMALELVQALSAPSEAISNSGATFRDLAKAIISRSRATASLLHARSEESNELKILNFLLHISELMAIFLPPDLDEEFRLRA